MKKFIFPALVILLGTGAAFATGKANKSKNLIVKGYHFDNVEGLCIKTEQDCSTVYSNDLCTWGVDGPSLREEGSTVCENPLYMIPQN